MGEMLAERRAVVEEIFKDYDFECMGELSAIQLQIIHSDMRVGGISLPQVEASIEYACVGNTCELSELISVLQEMDRRYYLVQDLRWEFSMLDRDQKNAISEEKAKWLVQTVHGKYFNRRKWEHFIRQRSIPGSGVCFAEIEVMLCNIPSRREFLTDKDEEKREDEERMRHEEEMQRIAKLERERQRRERQEARQRQAEEDKKRQKEDDRKMREEEEERRLRQQEKEEADRLRKKHEEEEERGRREAEERENKELQEANRLKELQRQEEERRRKDEEDAKNAEKILDDAIIKEQAAEIEIKKHSKRKQEAKDDNVRKDAENAEDRARLKHKEFRNKRIRYNLKVSVKKRDRERLPPAVADFKKAQLPDDDLDLEKAERILKEFKAREGLKKAMTSRQLQALEQAIAYVKRNGFEMQLSKELLEANKILMQLRRLERIRAEILELKQSTVAEIRSYQKPPTVVHTVMTSTFLLLGHKEKETKDWKTVQALVGKTGKDGLKRRCLECKPEQLNEKEARRANYLLSTFELDDVRDVSAGAATFYLWTITMIEELENTIAMKKAEKEEKKREREEMQKRQEEEKKRQAEQAAKAAEEAETMDDEVNGSAV